MKRTSFLILATLGLAMCLSPAGAAPKEKFPEGAKLVSVQARPAAVDLKYQYDYSQVLLIGQLENGDHVDVTRMAEVAVPGDLVTVSPTGLVRPHADGSGALTFSVGGQSVAVPVKVSGQKEDYKVSFVRDVMPAMSKLGCNAGTCHGSLNGKNGFKLSLRGYDPLFDHRALTDDIAARRINRAAPDQSLMLLKPSGVIPHVGGVLTHPGEPSYELLRAWIAKGVKLDLDSPRVAKIELFPVNPVVPTPGMTQQMTVMATYSNGAIRDVTLEAFVSSGNTEVADADKLGLVTAIRRGEAPMLARFEGAYTATTVTVMGDRSGYEWRQPPTNNYIDELVYNKLKRVKSLPSALCSDAEFMRRVSLDLTGLPPSPEELRTFVNDPRETKVKRDELVDDLIGNGDYVEYWTNKWADLLQVNRKFLGEEGAFALRNWIKQAVASNMPYDKFAYSVLTASGSTLENPPAAYYKILRTPGDLMENTTQLFLAVRFNCNKCHDHPFERWTQGQYYHLAAYFAQVERKGDPASAGKTLGATDVEAGKPLIEDIFDSGSGEVNDLGTGKVAAPAFPYQHADVAPATAPRREQVAKWIASKDNQYFARSYVNRLWGYLFGRGIIEPIDDIRAGNPPTNPELLDRLEKEFIANGFNAQEMMRTICKSRSYQQSIVTNKWNQDDDINFSHAMARRLPAEALYDSLQRATGAVSHLPGVPAGYRAAQLPDVGLTLPSGFFEVFGRPARESACECERSTGMMLGPVMTLVNGPTIAEAISDPDNAITKLVATQPDDAKVVEELFMRVLNRPPTESEVAEGVKALRNTDQEQSKAGAELAALEQKLDAAMPEWEAAHAPVTWTVLDPAEMKSSATAKFSKQADNSILVESGQGASVYTVVAPSDLNGISAIKLELLADPSLPNRGPGRGPSGNFSLTEFRLAAAPKAEPAKAVNVTLPAATADYGEPAHPIQAAIDSNPGSSWSIVSQPGKDHVATFEMKDPLNMPGGMVLTVSLEQGEAAEYNVGKFRLSVTTRQRPLTSAPLPPPIEAILAVAAANRTDAQKKELIQFYHANHPEWVKLNQTVAAAAVLATNKRLGGAQDLAWALINSPAFLFNR